MSDKVNFFALAVLRVAVTVPAFGNPAQARSQRRRAWFAGVSAAGNRFRGNPERSGQVRKHRITGG